jgi:hypothetical protein
MRGIPMFVLVGVWMIASALSFSEAQSTAASTGINAGQISVSLKKKFFSREAVSQGSKLRIHLEWQMTFADYVVDSGTKHRL